MILIAEMLGVPPEDRERFKIWSARRARLLEPMIDPGEREAGEAASRAFDAYFRPVIEARRTEPRDDIVTALAQAEDGGGRLSERETLNMLRLLLSAGNETSANLIGNAITGLASPSRTASAAEERPEPDPGGGRRAVAVRLSGAGGFPARARGLRGERLCTAQTRQCRPASRRSQPGSGRLRGSRPP